MNNKSINKPFLKWAGNKFRLISKITHHFSDEKRLIEPFLGSGAVFLNTNFKQYILSDTNKDLINLYNLLKYDGDEFIKYTRRYFNKGSNTPEIYYKRRDDFNSTKDLRKKSALFIYLNRHGYNGLCRYNSNGGFNVPFGRYIKPYFPKDEMIFFHKKSQQAIFKHQDFSKTISQSKYGDIIYCDPPYVPLSNSANFTTYSPAGFSEKEQKQLALLAKEMSNKRIPVIISNHDTKLTKEIYIDANRHEYFSVRRFISCNGKKRKLAGEVLAIYDKAKK